MDGIACWTLKGSNKKLRNGSAHETGRFFVKSFNVCQKRRGSPRRPRANTSPPHNCIMEAVVNSLLTSSCTLSMDNKSWCTPLSILSHTRYICVYALSSPQPSGHISTTHSRIWKQPASVIGATSRRHWTVTKNWRRHARKELEQNCLPTVLIQAKHLCIITSKTTVTIQ